jgi:hypothetical protein
MKYKIKSVQSCDEPNYVLMQIVQVHRWLIAIVGNFVIAKHCPNSSIYIDKKNLFG